MLISKPQELPYIGIFKTISGEEFIARVIEETSSNYTVEKPLCMVMAQQGLQFAPFLMMADPEKTIVVPKPLVVGTPAQSIKDQYDAVTSRIMLPKKQGIIS